MISPPNSTELKSDAKPEPTALALPQSALPQPALPQRKARRNHSEIERRRRLKLNAKYNELRELVPNCRAFRFAKRGGDAGLHKLDILTEAVEYIRQLEAREVEPKVLSAPVPPAVQPLQAHDQGHQGNQGNQGHPHAHKHPQPKHNISFLIN